MNLVNVQKNIDELMQKNNQEARSNVAGYGFITETEKDSLQSQEDIGKILCNYYDALKYI